MRCGVEATGEMTCCSIFGIKNHQKSMKPLSWTIDTGCRSAMIMFMRALSMVAQQKESSNHNISFKVLSDEF